MVARIRTTDTNPPWSVVTTDTVSMSPSPQAPRLEVQENEPISNLAIPLGSRTCPRSSIYSGDCCGSCHCRLLGLEEMKTLLTFLAIFASHFVLGLASTEEVDWATWWSGTPWIAFIFVIAILKLRIRERLESSGNPLGRMTRWFLTRSYNGQSQS